MSADDILIVEETLKGLMLPDNTLRREAEIKLENLMTNKPALAFCLSHVLVTSQDLSLLTYSAVVLRKLIEVKDDEIAGHVWKQTTNEMKEIIKKNVATSLVNTINRNLKLKICDVAVELCINVFESEETWEDILQYIITGFSAELSESNLLLIESSVYLLAHIFHIANDELTKALEVLIRGFSVYFASDNLNLKTRSVEAITEILTGSLSKKTSKKFREFVFYMLETTLKCLEASEQNNLKICLTSLCDLAETEPGMLRKSFNDIFILMGKVIEKKDDIEDNVREIAFEIIVNLIEKREKLISKDTEKMQLLVQTIFKYSMEIDNTIDDDWCTPKTESFFDEDIVQESKLEEALSLLDRLVTTIGKDPMLAIISDNVMQLLSHSSTEWKYKYIAYMTIGRISEHVDDIQTIDSILQMIFKDLENENPKIRYACLSCISEMSENFNPDFQNIYHEKVFTFVNARIISENVLRVQLAACTALQDYIEHCTDQVAGTYVQQTLDAVFTTFLKGENEVPVSLREGLIDVVSELVSSSKKEFTPYAEKCLNILITYLGMILKSGTNKSLFGMMLEIISIIGPLCEEAYLKYLPDIISTLIEIQNNIKTFKDPIAPYLQSTWEKIIPLLPASNSEIAVKVIESTLNVITILPEMSVDTLPEKKFDIKDFLSGVDSQGEVHIEKKKMSMVTSDTEDYAAFLELLALFITQFKAIYAPYIDATQKNLFPILAYPNEDIRENASNCLPELLDVIKLHSPSSLNEFSKLYLSELINVLRKESDNGVIATFLDNIGKIIEHSERFLSTPEINILCSELLSIFDKVEKSRLALLNQREKVEDDIIKDKESGNDKIFSDDEEEEDENEQVLHDIEDEIADIEEVLISYTDVIGSVFKTHRELSLEIVNKLLTELLPKYFSDKASVFEKKMGLFILDDMVEFLGQELLINIWSDIAKTMLPFTDSKEPELRQASCYGIGEFAKHTKTDFHIYVNELLSAIYKAIDVSSDGEDMEEWGHARDNAITALGKVIKHQSQYIDLKFWVEKWVGYLPITCDTNEGPGMHMLLCDIITTNPSLVVGDNNANLPKIIRILAKVYNDDKLSDDETNKKIKLIFDNLKENPEMQRYIELAKMDCDKKILVKIKEHFP